MMNQKVGGESRAHLVGVTSWGKTSLMILR